jgi:hypothetical protein
MGYRPAVKFEFGRLPKRKNAPRVKFDFEPLNPKMDKIPRSNIWVLKPPQKDKFPQSKI